MNQRRPIRLLANSQQLLDAIAEHGPMTPAEAAAHTGIPRPSVYRLADGLAAVGMTSTTSEGRIALTLRWLHLSDDAREGMQEWNATRQALALITEETDQTAFLTLPRSTDAVCVDWSPGRGIGVLILKPGRSLPLYAGAAGRVVLAHSTDPETYLRQAPFEALTPKTLTTRAALLEDVARTREQGYVHSDEDATVGIGALGVPLIGPRGQIAACLSLAGVARDVHDRREELLDVLRRHAAEWTADREASARA